MHVLYNYYESNPYNVYKYYSLVSVRVIFLYEGTRLSVGNSKFPKQRRQILSLLQAVAADKKEKLD